MEVIWTTPGRAFMLALVAFLLVEAPREEMRLKPNSTCGNLAQREVFEYSEAPARPQYPTGYCERAGAFEYTEICRCATSRL